MEKYLSSGGDKNSKNYLSKIFNNSNNSKEKNRKCKCNLLYLELNEFCDTF